MNVKWNKEEIFKLLCDFSKVSHVNINIYDNDFCELYDGKVFVRNYCEEIHKTCTGKERCFLSDKALMEKCRETKKAQNSVCHAGLTDIAIPIILNDEIAGYTILGQIRTEENFENVFKRIKNIEDDKEKMQKYYEEMPFFDDEHIKSLTTVATVFAKYIFTKELCHLEENDVIKSVIAYMNDNLKNNICVEDITKNTGVCKSTLYKYFKNEYNCTPKEYLNKMRVTQSLKMLLCTDYSIRKISEESGFSDISYYSKIFRKMYGMSPLCYRKENKTEITQKDVQKS